MSRKIIFAENEFYHLYNRGVDKRIVFENEWDYKRFILLLYLCNGKIPVRFEDLPNWKSGKFEELAKTVFAERIDSPIIAIGAYCLMPNHFHLLIREISEKAYTMYFNESRKRTGSLFQGRFKAEHADTDMYLKYLFSYIHLNPIKLVEPKWKEFGIVDRQRVKRFLFAYQYSSLPDYSGTTRECSKILNKKEFPDYFSTKKDVERHIDDWLIYKKYSSCVGKAQPYPK